MNLGWFKEFWPQFCQTYMDIIGPQAMLAEGPDAPCDGHFEHYFRASFGNHAGGTAQLKRMTMATRPRAAALKNGGEQGMAIDLSFNETQTLLSASARERSEEHTSELQSLLRHPYA